MMTSFRKEKTARMPSPRTTHGVHWCVVLMPLLALLLAACGGNGDDSPLPDPSPTASSPATPATLSPTLVRLQQDYELLDAAHSTMSTIWEGLATGEAVQCGTYPELINPDGISNEGDTQLTALAENLRQAAINLDQSVRLWRAECNNPRTNPSPDIINEGRLVTRSAGDALAAARATLRTIQGD